MTIWQILGRVWPLKATGIEHEEAENENLLRDHDAAMIRIQQNNEEIAQSQNKLLESIRLTKPHEMRETIKTMLERNRWRG